MNIGVFDPAACHPTEVRGLRAYLPPREQRAEFVLFEATVMTSLDF